VRSSRLSWGASYCTIFYYTVLSFDLEQAQQLQPNSCHCLCFSTASVSVLSSSFVQLPLRAIVSALVGSKALYQVVTPFITLCFRSTRNKHSNCSPVLSIVLLYCICKCAIFFFCPVTLARDRLGALAGQVVMPSTPHCCFVRPGTSATIAAQSLRLSFFTASFNVLSSSVVHLPCAVVLLVCPIAFWCPNHTW
jgi:hypothetical protein